MSLKKRAKKRAVVPFPFILRTEIVRTKEQETNKHQKETYKINLLAV